MQPLLIMTPPNGNFAMGDITGGPDNDFTHNGNGTSSNHSRFVE